jgi:aminocarboxymuconate-semialdehyde decarboxylase
VNNCKRPHDYLRSFYVDSLVQDARTLRFLIELMTVERIALGSDYPFPLGEEHPGRLIEAMPELSDADRERLLSGTALEFLGLRRETFASRAGARS